MYIYIYIYLCNWNDKFKVLSTLQITLVEEYQLLREELLLNKKTNFKTEQKGQEKFLSVLASSGPLWNFNNQRLSFHAVWLTITCRLVCTCKPMWRDHEWLGAWVLIMVMTFKCVSVCRELWNFLGVLKCAVSLELDILFWLVRMLYDPFLINFRYNVKHVVCASLYKVMMLNV